MSKKHRVVNEKGLSLLLRKEIRQNPLIESEHRLPFPFDHWLEVRFSGI